MGLTHDIDPGKLDRKVEVLTPTYQKDVIGSPELESFSSTDAYALVIYPTTGEREDESAGAERQVADVTFVIRYIASLDVGNSSRMTAKIKYKGSEFDIINIREHGRSQYLYLDTVKYEGHSEISD